MLIFVAQLKSNKKGTGSSGKFSDSMVGNTCSYFKLPNVCVSLLKSSKPTNRTEIYYFMKKFGVSKSSLVLGGPKIFIFSKKEISTSTFSERKTYVESKSGVRFEKKYVC